MTLFLSAVKHMTLWGLLGGAGFGALYGSGLTLLAARGLFAGLLFGSLMGGGVGLLVGVFSGILLGLINWRFTASQSDALDYGWMLGSSISVFAFGAAWIGFSAIFGGTNNVAMPGLPALISSLTLTFASKRFADGFYYVYRNHSQKVDPHTV